MAWQCSQSNPCKASLGAPWGDGGPQFQQTPSRAVQVLGCPLRVRRHNGLSPAILSSQIQCFSPGTVLPPREGSVMLTTGVVPLATMDREQGATNHPPGDRTVPRAKNYLTPNNKNTPKTLHTNSVVANSVYIWELSRVLLQMSAPGLPSG